MKTLNTLVTILLLASTSFGAKPAPYTFGWLGDDGKKIAPSLAPNQWPITKVADSSDLSGDMIVLNQEDIGSCVAHGTTEAWDYVYHLVTGKHLQQARLQVYYDARKKIGTVNSDSGCQIVDAVNNLMSIGGGNESLWPYQTSRYKIKPIPAVYQSAKKNLAVKAFKVDNTDNKSIPLALTNGYPVIVGSMVYKGIYGVTSSKPILPLPKAGERPIGGHCYLIVGHDNKTQLFKAMNSWGTSWGKKGFFYVPYSYIFSGRITEDCWVIKEVSKQ